MTLEKRSLRTKGALTLVSGLAIVAAVVLRFAGQNEPRIGPESLEAPRGGPTEVRNQAQSHQQSQQPIALPSNTAHPNDTDRRLPEHEEKMFFSDVESVFSGIAQTSLDMEAVRPHLMRLNEKRRSGVRSILAYLGEPSRTDQVVQQKLFLVDYLKYRMGWDPRAMEDIARAVLAPIPSGISDRSRAAMYVDRGELVNGIARIDWDRAGEIIKSIREPKLKHVVSFEAWMGLIESGVDRDSALKRVQKINPVFRG